MTGAPRVAVPLSTDESRHAATRRVLIVVLFANVAVVVAKAVVGLWGDVLSVVAEAAHSSVDALNNVLALAMARVASQAPDEEHPYGHGKFEVLGALAVVAFLSVTMYELLVGAVERLLAGGGNPDASATVFVVMGMSAIVSLVVSTYEERRGRELGSTILVADALHTRSDVYASLAVLAGLVLIRLGFPAADPLVTLLVAAAIGRAGWRILRTTVPVLVDERAVAPAEIRGIALQTPGVEGAYDVRSRGRTGEIFAELTVAVDGALDVERAHAIADRVERRVAEAVGAMEVVVHVEPAQAEAGGGAAAAQPRTGEAGETSEGGSARGAPEADDRGEGGGGGGARGAREPGDTGAPRTPDRRLPKHR